MPRRRLLAAALAAPLATPWAAWAQAAQASADGASNGAADAAPPPVRKPAAAKAVPARVRRSAYPIVAGRSFWLPEIAPEGPVVALVNLHTQHVQIYRNGVAIGYSSASTGRQGKGTPVGLFNVLEKRRHHRSNLYNNAPMPWMVRLTWDGIAFHQGVLPGFPASHGCIRLPGAFAPHLFDTLQRGSAVAVVRLSPTAGRADSPLTTLAPIAPDGKPLLHNEILAQPVYWDAAAAAAAPAAMGAVGAVAGGDGASAAISAAVPPVTLLASLSQRRLFVLQGGRVLGAAALPDTVTAAALQGQTLFNWTAGGQWQVAGLDHTGLDDVLWRDVLSTPPEFAQRLRGVLAPGSTLLVSNLPAVSEVHAEVYKLKARS